MAEWIGIAVSLGVGVVSAVLAWKAYRLARSQDDAARSQWVMRAYATGPTASEKIVLQFFNEGSHVAWHPEVDAEDFKAFAILSENLSERVKPGECVSLTVRPDLFLLGYPRRVRIRWRVAFLKGRQLEYWVDAKPWLEAAQGIQSHQSNRLA